MKSQSQWKTQTPRTSLARRAARQSSALALSTAIKMFMFEGQFHASFFYVFLFLVVSCQFVQFQMWCLDECGHFGRTTSQCRAALCRGRICSWTLRPSEQEKTRGKNQGNQGERG